MGAILYEIITGLPPFYQKDQSKMYNSILNEPLNIPQNVSKIVRNLLSRLLEKDSSKRMGSQRGIEEIKEHPWFHDVDWKKYEKLKVDPPFKVNYHITNFDPNYSSNNVDIDEIY